MGAVTYRDPDLRERVCELEAELNKLREENAALRKKRRWAWLGSVWAGITAALSWFWSWFCWVLLAAGVIGVLVFVGYLIKKGNEPHAEATVDVNGRPSFVIECLNGRDCALLAGRSCPHGYEVTKEMPDGLLIVCKEEKKP